MNEEIKEILNYFRKYSTIRENTMLTEIEDYITNLQEENEKIRKLNMYEHKYGSEMEGKYLIEKAKNDKAVEYIKEDMYIEPNELYGLVDGYQLLDILNGKE